MKTKAKGGETAAKAATDVAAREEAGGIKLLTDPDFENLLPRQSDEELGLLKRQLLAEGCLEPLAVWRDPTEKVDAYRLVDGYARRDICERNNISFRTRKLELPDREAVKEWILAHHLGRRNLGRLGTSYLRGLLYLARKRQGERAGRTSGQIAQKSTTAQRIAAEDGVDEKTVRRDAAFAGAVDEIVKSCGEGSRAKLKRLLLGGKLKCTQADVLSLAKMKADKRKRLATEIVTAGKWPERARAVGRSSRPEPGGEPDRPPSRGRDAGKDATPASSGDGDSDARDDVAGGGAEVASECLTGAARDLVSAPQPARPHPANVPAIDTDPRDSARRAGLESITDCAPEEAAELLTRVRGQEWSLTLGRALVDSLG